MSPEDRKARLAFVTPALSANPAERGAFFASLKALSNRQHEPWVLDGLRYLHHPLRASASEPYIRPSLDLLGEDGFPVRHGAHGELLRQHDVVGLG